MMSYGAITVINAIPCGIGATVGIDLTTEAKFDVYGSRRTVKIINDPHEDTKMAEICVRNTFGHFRIEEPEGWSLSVDSRIPISRGLKSSSSACNAIVSEVAEFISKEYGMPTFDDPEKSVLDMIRLGVRCAKDANVTVTGAFDDACGCQLGGLVITDNSKNTLLFRGDTEENDVILLIPNAKIRKPSLDVEKFYEISERSKELAELAKKDWHGALTKNGSMIARVVGIDDKVADDAVRMGALAAGVSGTGPAISVVVKKNEGVSFLKDLYHEGYDPVIVRTR